MADTWLAQVLATAQPLQTSAHEQALINKFLDVIDKQGYSAPDHYNALAAAFDLMVAAEYYGSVAHIGWLYCPLPEPLLLYPYPTYWFTNSCGQPIPRPDTWPHRAGTGYESVSDSKTSVGIDRTDDIKKGTYQILKLGAEGNPSSYV